MNFISNYAEKEFHKKDIHELRNIARSVGVSQPTSKKKETLIEDILLVMTGKQQPEYKNINRGRPAKNHGEVSYSAAPYMLSFQAASHNNDYHDLTDRSGVVVKNDNLYFVKKLRFADSSSDFELSNDDVKKFSLKDNDLIEYNFAGGKLVVTMINGRPVAKNEKRKIEGKTIVFGAVNVLKVDLSLQKQKIANSIDGRVLFVPSTSADMFESKNVTMMPVCGLSDPEIANGFCAAMSFATLYQKSGEQTTVVFSNFVNVLSCIKGANYVGLGEQVIDYLNRFVQAGGTFVGFVPTILEKIDFVADNID